MEGVAALRSADRGRAIGGFPLTIWTGAARMLIDQYSTAYELTASRSLSA